MSVSILLPSEYLSILFYLEESLEFEAEKENENIENKENKYLDFTKLKN